MVVTESVGTPFVSVGDLEALALWARASVQMILSALLTEESTGDAVVVPRSSLMTDAIAMRIVAMVPDKILDQPSAPKTSEAFGNGVKEALQRPDLRGQRGWQVIVERELQRHLGMFGVYTFPAHFWQLFGDRAWAEANHLLWTAQHLEAFLRQRAFMQVGGFCDMTLSPRVGWLLLAIVLSPSPEANQGQEPWFRRTRPTPQSRRIEIATARVVWACETYGLTKNWASVWDQFVLMEAARRWDASRWLPFVRNAVAGLPLRDFYPPHLDWSNLVMGMEARSGDVVRADWMTETPNWFFAWLKSRSEPL